MEHLEFRIVATLRRKRLGRNETNRLDDWIGKRTNVALSQRAVVGRGPITDWKERRIGEQGNEDPLKGRKERLEEWSRTVVRREPGLGNRT